jgi:hypothetical protein
MDTTTPTGEAQRDRVKELADRLDYLTEEDFQLLAQATPGTVEAWRRRGQGPAYVRLGNRVLYPRKAVAAHLETLTRERKAPGKALL